MGTRSAIGYRLPLGSVRASYCHWDGYKSHQLPILEEHYNSTAKVKALIKPGSFSSLEADQTEIDYHGDGFMPAKTSSRPLDYWFKECCCDFLYVWDGQKWLVYSDS